jgi:hypothetical protein
MLFFSNLFFLLALFAYYGIIGRAIGSLLPKRLSVYVNGFFAPALGIAVMTPLVSALGWFGDGFGSGFEVWVTYGLVALAALHLWRRGDSGVWKLVGPALLICTISSIPVFIQLLRFEGLDPFNDGYSYLYHGQWLQTHSFRNPPELTGFRSGSTMIQYYQLHGFRMGGSFLLAWSQGLFGLAWSHAVYPAALMVPTASGVLAIAGVLFAAIGRMRALCLAAGFLTSLTFNGVTFGSLYGFLPQSYGLVMGLLAMCLFFLTFRLYPRATLRQQVALIFPSAACGGAFLFIYPELSPFIACGILLSTGVLAWKKRRIATGLIRGLVLLAVECLLLTNIELFRTVKALLFQRTAVVGGPIVWSPLHSLLHTFGFISGPWDGKAMMLSSEFASILMLAVILIPAGAGAWFLARRRLELTVPVLVTLAIWGVAWTWFFQFATNPWTKAIGHDWNQFRVSGYATYYVMLLVGFGLVGFAAQFPRARWAVWALVLVWEGIGIQGHSALAGRRTEAMRDLTGFRRSPLVGLEQLAQGLDPIPPKEPIYLANMGEPYGKIRQFLTYIFSDRDVYSDWRQDDYIGPHLPPEERNRPEAEAAWVLSLRPGGNMVDADFRFGHFVLSMKGIRVSLRDTIGGFGEEKDASGTWRWTSKNLIYKFRMRGNLPAKAEVHFETLTTQPDSKLRSLRMRVADDHPDVNEMKVAPGWQKYKLATTLDSPEFEVVFETDEPGVRANNADPRDLAFLVKNLKVVPVEQK